MKTSGAITTSAAGGPVRRRIEAKNERVRRERLALALKPWQFAPSEVGDGVNPYASTCVGYASWEEAQAMRRELRNRDPDYLRGKA